MNHWDERFSAEGYLYGTEPSEFLVAHAAAIPAGGAVLCLGEGEGRNATYLAQQGFRVTAVDQSPVGLDKARRLAASRQVSIDTVVADVTTFALGDAAWDGIVSIWCHLPSRQRSELHHRAVKALRSGGVVLIEAYTPAQLRHGTGGPRDVDLLPTLAGLRADLTGLELVHAVETERLVREGTGHDGLSAVVQVVARR